MNQRIVGKPACYQAGILFVYLFHQCLQRQARQAFHLLSGCFLHRAQHFVKAFLHNLLRYLVFHGRRGGSCPFGINKGKGIVKPHLFNNVYSFLHILRRFSGEAHNNIRRQGDIRYGGAYFFHQGQILFLRIAPVHGLQDSGGAGLQRQVQMTAYLFGGSHHLYQFIG